MVAISIEKRKDEWMGEWQNQTNKQKVEKLLKDLPPFYKELPVRELKKLFMHAETYLFKKIKSPK